MFFNKPFRKKASLELSVSFLVKLILAVVVFGFGLIIVRNLLSTLGSGELTRDIDAELENQIKSMMIDGGRVLVFPQDLETRRNRAVSFGLGVFNVLNRPQATTFNVEVYCYKFTPRNTNQLLDCPYGHQDWTFDEYETLNLRNEEKGTINIAVRPRDNVEQGVYTYNVEVTYDDGELYGIDKFRVRVD